MIFQLQSTPLFYRILTVLHYFIIVVCLIVFERFGFKIVKSICPLPETECILIILRYLTIQLPVSSPLE